MNKLSIAFCVAVGFAGCGWPQSNEQITRQQEYDQQEYNQQEYDQQSKTAQQEREWNEAHGGYNASIYCHTADGGYYSSTCDTETSCSVLRSEIKNICAVPNGKAKIVENGDCVKATVAPTPVVSSCINCMTTCSTSNGCWHYVN